ncbi:hypothetical protein BKA70DRAFT_483148 [Coprinopsis sp. MPI-PUGE-AT-0042]|nr:hypothetical protein BKA70DRAFT_483148 [Coprinopsis sp. MPI-PUGE-AT-0042]
MADHERAGPPLLALPTELLLGSAQRLEIPDVLALRQCNRLLYEVTHDRSLWASVLHRLQKGCPLPPELVSEPQFGNLTASTLERFATRYHRIQCLWPKSREKDSTFTLPRPNQLEVSSLLGIQVLQNRWLLSVYTEGILCIRDLDAKVGATSLPSWNFDMGANGWGSYIASVDDPGKCIYVAATTTLPPFTLNIYSFSVEVAALSGTVEPQSPFRLVQSIPLDHPKLVRAIEPSSQLAALSASTTVELTRWGGELDKICAPIPKYPDDPQDLWNGIVAAHFIGPFLLISKTRSLEVHHYTPALDPSVPLLPPARHYFAYRTIREVSFSHSRTISSSSSQEAYEITMLASDVIQGLFQFLVKIHVLKPSSQNSTPGALNVEVELIGLYPLSLLIAPHPAGLHSPGSNTPTPLTVHSQFFGRKGEVSRGFLSTFCLGPQGKRAIWVERARSSVSREVQVWDFNMRPMAASRELQEQWHSHFGEDCMEMEKNVVHTVGSYDLRDDITHCTFSETMGTVVLGTRSGNIHVLPLLNEN